MLTFVDLFCGGGFGARGAVRAGGRPLLAVDAWSVAVETYRDNFPEAEVICSAIEHLDPLELASTHSPDVLLTSPECTSHSIARGAKPGSETSRATAIGILPWLEALSPRWLIVENVNRMRRWDRHEELINTIEQAGYRVNDLFLNAADFGAPQSRKRMFLVCDREQSQITKRDLLRGHQAVRKSAREIIAPEGTYRSTPLLKPGRAEATIARANRAISTLGKGEDFIIVYYGSDYAGGWQSLDAPLRTITTLDRFGLVTWRGRNAYLRMLQPDELKQAMGADDHNLSYGTRREKVKLCGNGVCAPVLEAIFREISKAESPELAAACS